MKNQKLIAIMFAVYIVVSFVVFTISVFWGFPGANLWLAMMAVMSSGVGLEILREKTHDGKIVLTETNDKMLFTLQLAGDPEGLVEKDSVSFKIEKGEPVAEFEL